MTPDSTTLAVGEYVYNRLGMLMDLNHGSGPRWYQRRQRRELVYLRDLIVDVESRGVGAMGEFSPGEVK